MGFFVKRPPGRFVFFFGEFKTKNLVGLKKKRPGFLEKSFLFFYFFSWLDGVGFFFWGGG